jgi:hypothetical protein
MPWVTIPPPCSPTRAGTPAGLPLGLARRGGGYEDYPPFKADKRYLEFLHRLHEEDSEARRRGGRDFGEEFRPEGGYYPPSPYSISETNASPSVYKRFCLIANLVAMIAISSPIAVMLSRSETCWAQGELRMTHRSACYGPERSCLCRVVQRFLAWRGSSPTGRLRPVSPGLSYMDF